VFPLGFSASFCDTFGSYEGAAVLPSPKTKLLQEGRCCPGPCPRRSFQLCDESAEEWEEGGWSQMQDPLCLGDQRSDVEHGQRDSFPGPLRKVRM
jgi:hypothetical protein